MTLRTFAAVALCLAVLVASASAATVFQTTLTGAGENPPNGSPGAGTAVVTLNTAETMLEVNLTFSGITAPASAAHIHCCAGPGVNAAVVLNFVGNGFPVGATSGTFDHTFTLATDLAGISVPDFLTGLFAGTAYANIHDANFPVGEIRGQLAATTPEPGTWALMGLSVATLAAIRRTRRPRELKQ